jgi:hypothetical protein
MRGVKVGALAAVAVILSAVGWYGLADEGHPLAVTESSAGELIALDGAAGNQARQVILIDPRRRSMGVYHIDRGSGEISLKGVRNFNWDLQMLHFNSANPRPQDVRSMLEGKQ